MLLVNNRRFGGWDMILTASLILIFAKEMYYIDYTV